MPYCKRRQSSDSDLMLVPGVNVGLMVFRETLQACYLEQRHAALSHGSICYEAEQTLSSAALSLEGLEGAGHSSLSPITYSLPQLSTCAAGR